MKRELRDQLNQLSKEVFGTSSRWQKIINNGVLEPYERDREVMIPRANGTLDKKTFTDKKTVVRHYSVEEVLTLMNEILEKRKNVGQAVRETLEKNVVGQSTTLQLEGDKFVKGMKVEGQGIPEGTTIK